MLLNRDQFQSMGLIQNSSPRSCKPASYDLQVGKIIDNSGNVVESTALEPQGMVRVTSKERIKLPSDVLGNATVRTSLCDGGILAINIGIIDPGYEGLISSTLINFGKSRYPIRPGDIFLRVTFHKLSPCKDSVPPSGKPDEEYVRDKIMIATQSFSPTFLNVEATATEAAKKVVGDWRTKSLVYVSAVALLITATVSLLTTFTAITTTRSYINSDQEQMKSDMRYLRQELEQLKRQASSAQPQPGKELLPSAHQGKP